MLAQKVVETMPAKDGTLSSAEGDYFVRFDQPVDHIHSTIDIMQDGKTVQTLRPRLKSEPNCPVRAGAEPAARQVRHALVGPRGERIDRVPGRRFVLGGEGPTLIGRS